MKRKIVKIKQLVDFKISRGRQPLIFDFTAMQFRFSLAKQQLLEKIDGLIAKERDFTILNLPFCFVLGYRRYGRFSPTPTIGRIEKCQGCCYSGFCKGVSQHYVKKFGDTEVVPPGQDQSLTDLERCLLKILSFKDNLSSQKVLALSKKINLCSTCDDGAIIFTVGERMIRRGLVQKHLKGKQYYWSLIETAYGKK